VLLAVVVDAEGRPKSISVKTSSGYERLDQAALKAVAGWTFVPGKRNGVPSEMAVDVPIRFKPPE
jgi:protein TonB